MPLKKNNELENKLIYTYCNKSLRKSQKIPL